MIESRADSAPPHIDIARDGDGIVIRQHRPSMLSCLEGMEVDRALELVPRVLPICGIAQSVAAARAVEAALDRRPDAVEEGRRETQLWWEQALSAGWRLSVDWPDLLDQPRKTTWLKALRNCSTPRDCAGTLEGAVTGLDRVSCADELEAWVRESDSVAGAMARRALDGGVNSNPLASGEQRLGGDTLANRARELMGNKAFDPLSPGEESVEVGPLAMARDPLIANLGEVYGATVTGRLLALLVDTRLIARGLRGDADPGQGDGNAWREGELTGTGRALTARGPVFHRVMLDPSGRVSRWRALAPTDWHFAPRGPVAAALAACTSRDEAERIVASFDPCAPWTLQLGGGD